MGVIKTALEIALEKTNGVKSDKSSIDQYNAKQRGKKVAGFFMAGEADLSREIKETPDDQRDSLKQGIFEVLISQISLPSVSSDNKDDEKRIESAGNGLSVIINNKQFSKLFQQLTQVISQFSRETTQYDQAIKQQYAPKLRQKEEELSRRLGREVRIDPFQDAEFVAFYNQHMNALKGNYETAVTQVKEEARNMFMEAFSK
ncbi:MAG: hypothetical protein FWC19_00810 [Treponema sp.]|nr:hypothetical protein [Treponema sp.]MCL2271332.1 hypothetical protein [Treponema sp.]